MSPVATVYDAMGERPKPAAAPGVLARIAIVMPWVSASARVELAEACAAVTELLEADKEFDAAYLEFPAVGTATKHALDSAAARINTARARRAAALARVCGAK